MKCPNCNNEIKPNGDYCPKCGFNLANPPLLGSIDKFSQKVIKLKEVIGDLKRKFTDDKDSDEQYNIALFYSIIKSIQSDLQSKITEHLNMPDPYDDKEWHDFNAKKSWKQKLKRDCAKWEEWLDYYLGKYSKNNWINDPYAHRIICFNKTKGIEEDIYFGKERIVDWKTGKVIVEDALGPLSDLLYVSTEDEMINLLQTEFVTREYRKILIGNQRLKGVNRVYPNKDETEAKLEADQYLFRVLQAMRDTGQVTSIYKSITNAQYKLIKSDFQKNLILQGCAGCGKTMVLFHRIKHAIVNNVGNISPENIFVLTPSDSFNEFIKPLIEDLNISNLNISSITKFYLTVLSYVYPNYEISSDNANVTEYYKYLDLSKNIGFDFETQIENNTKELLKGILKEFNGDSKKIEETIDNILEFSKSLNNLKKLYSDIDLSHIYIKKHLDKLDAALKKVRDKKNFKKFYILDNFIRFNKPKAPLFAKKLTSEQTKQMQQLIKIFKNISTFTNINNFNLYQKWIPNISRLNKKAIMDYIDKTKSVDLLNSNLANFVFDNKWIKSKFAKLIFKHFNTNDFCDLLEKMKLLPDYDLPKEVVEYYYSQEFQDKIFNIKNLNIYPIKNDVEKSTDIFNILFKYDKNNNIYSDILKNHDVLKTFKKEHKNINLIVKKEYINLIDNHELDEILPNYERKPGVIHKCEIYAILLVLMHWNQQSLDLNKINNNTVSFRASTVMIDEAQDISLPEYRLIDVLFQHKSLFNLFGDTNQGLYEHCIKSWSLLNSIFDADNATKILNVNYRNSFEVGNYVKSKFKVDMEAIGFKRFEVVEYKINDLPVLISNDTFKSKVIPLNRKAIICSPSIIKDLQKQFKVISKMFLTPYEAKGMEFDCVYVIEKNMTTNEKYVSCTRALDKLSIIKE